MSQKRETIASLLTRFRAGQLTDAELSMLGDDPRAGVQRLLKSAARRRQRAEIELARLDLILTHEKGLWERGLREVAGVDEVGAGPLAGPVVAAAVILPIGEVFPGVDDSKRVSRRNRERLDLEIRERSISVGIGLCSPAEIDRINILEASRLAMRRAVEKLSPAAEHLLVDARTIPGVRVSQTPIIHGDQSSQSIAAASIIAKVYRDRLMEELAQEFPGYGFEKHRGYGTKAHIAAIRELGPSPIHRRSFHVAGVC